MKLGTILRFYLGAEKSPEECNKVIADFVARLKQDDPNLSGQKWSIDLGDSKRAFGMFLAFSKSVHISEILKQDFPQINRYYMQLIKQSDEKGLFEKSTKPKESATAIGSDSI